MTRRTLWKGGGVRYLLDEKDDGIVLVMRATDYDDGPAKSVPIQPEALSAVAVALWRLSITRTFVSIGEQFRRARIAAGRAIPGDLPEEEESK